MIDLTTPDARMGLLAAGLAMLGARNGHVMEDFGRAGLLGLQTAQQADKADQQRQMQALQAQQLQQAIRAQQIQLDQAQAMRDALKSAYAGGGGPSPAMGAAMAQMPSLAPTNANVAAATSAAQAMPQQDPMQAQYQAMLSRANTLEQVGGKAGILPLIQQAEALRKNALAFAPQYSGTETLMQNGMPVVAQQFKNRAPQVLQGFQPVPDYKPFSNGQTSGFVDPLTKQLGPTWQMLMTPGEKASNAVAQENAATSRGNLAVNQFNAGLNQQRLGVSQADLALRQQGQALQRELANKGQVERDANGNLLVYHPLTQQTDAFKGPDGKPLPMKMLNQSQGQAVMLANQMIDASNKLAQLKAKGYDASTIFGQVGNEMAQDNSFIGGLSHALAPHQAQEYTQAEDQWIQALGYLQSGKRVGKEETEKMRQIYFPQANDPASVVRQKEQARRQEELNARAAMGPAGEKMLLPYGNGKRVIPFSMISGGSQ